MTKIELPDNIISGLIPGLLGKKTEKSKGANKNKSLFSVKLEEAEEEKLLADSLKSEPFSEAEIGELLNKVYKNGEELKHNLTSENIIEYKKAVRDFIHYVSKNAYSIEECSSSRDILKRKKFSSLSIIDKKLDKLAAEVLSIQKDQIDILRRIDEINGLLVDLIT